MMMNSCIHDFGDYWSNSNYEQMNSKADLKRHTPLCPYCAKESKKVEGDEKQGILAIALEVGFSLSTMHGQETNKLMPISDSQTLMRFAEAVMREARIEAIDEMINKIDSECKMLIKDGQESDGPGKAMFNAVIISKLSEISKSIRQLKEAV